MHTFIGSKNTTFHYNSDMSGDITIEKYKDKEIKIPGSDMLEFVLEYFVSQKIAKFEQITIEDFIDIL